MKCERNTLNLELKLVLKRIKKDLTVSYGALFRHKIIMTAMRAERRPFMNSSLLLYVAHMPETQETCVLVKINLQIISVEKDLKSPVSS